MEKNRHVAEEAFFFSSEPLVSGDMGGPAYLRGVDRDTLTAAALQPVVYDLGVGVNVKGALRVLEDLQPL